MEIGAKHHVVGFGTLIAVWVTLVALTAISLGAVKWGAGDASILVPLCMASVKAILVLMFFMHLKYEGRLLKLLFIMPVVTLAVIIGLTFVDISFR